MKTVLPRHDGVSQQTKRFPVSCTACGAVRMLDVSLNQPLVDVKTEAVKEPGGGGD
jgi:hypothetical protein